MKKIKNFILILLMLTILMTCKKDDNPLSPEKEYYTLKIIVDGEISDLYAYIDGGWSDGEFIEVNKYEYKIIKDATVVVSVSPINNNYRFMKVVWAGAIPEKENSESAKILMDSDKNVLITVSDEKTTLTVNKEGEGKFIVKTNGIDVLYDYEFWKGTEVELTAIPDTSYKYKFDKYIISDKEEVKNTNLTLIMNEDKNIKVLFKNTYTLTFDYNASYAAKYLFVNLGYPNNNGVYKSDIKPNTTYEIPTYLSSIGIRVYPAINSQYRADKIIVNGITSDYKIGFVIDNPNYEDKHIIITHRKRKTNLILKITWHLPSTVSYRYYPGDLFNSLKINNKEERDYGVSSGENFKHYSFNEDEQIQMEILKRVNAGDEEPIEVEKYSVNNGKFQYPTGYSPFFIGSQKGYPIQPYELKENITIDLYYKKVK